FVNILRPLLKYAVTGQVVGLCTLLILATIAAAEQRPLSRNLQNHVEKIVTEFSPRDYLNPKTLEKLAVFLRDSFSKAGGKASLQKFKVDKVKYSNVVATFGPPTKDRIIIGAHYDTAGPLPGADDNASGVAGLIELAKLLKDVKLSTRVELVAFALEEPPFFASENMGSAFHARSLREQGASVVGMLSLEMIGYFSSSPNSQEFPTAELKNSFPSIGNFIGVVGKKGEEEFIHCVSTALRQGESLEVSEYAGPTDLMEIQFSDHLSYWREGFRALMITDTAFLRNKNYHTSEDTPEKLNYEQMAKVVRGVFDAIISLDKDCSTSRNGLFLSVP
ncbi:UNVERIFIED_CONTAM: hypothetical protein GTU68_052800, partial [Idotea baltica]|nr:hypothetical protein [Idotea baltica]